MAAVDVIVLSSSPSRSLIATTPPPGSVALLSSSPRLPSPSQLLIRKKGGLVSGREALPSPRGAVTGFASAATLLRTVAPVELDNNIGKAGELGLAERFGLQEGGPEHSYPKDRAIIKSVAKTTIKKSRSSRKKASKDDVEDTANLKQPRTVAECDAPKVPVTKKPRAKKSKEESQTTIKKGKVTKSVTPSDLKKSTKAKGTARKSKSKTGVEKDGSEVKVGESAPREVLHLYLEGAMRRRKDWTPPKDTSHIGTDAAVLTEVPELLHGLRPSMADEAPFKNFTGLLSSYSHAHGRADVISNSVRLRTSEGKAPSKKRRIELIDTLACPPPPPSPPIPLKRSKPTKKKPQTITEKATAPFNNEGPAAASTLFQYFPAPAPNADAENQSADLTNQEQPSKSARRKTSLKAPAKTKAKTTTAKKQTPKAPILLSPESALKTASNQKLLFGTSSQLAREESPTFIRDLQQAIKASELIQEPTSFAESGSDAASAKSGSSTGSGMLLHAASRNLWSVAARDSQGTLLDAEVVNLVDDGDSLAVMADGMRQPEMRVPVEEEEDCASPKSVPTTRGADLVDFVDLPRGAGSQRPENRSIEDTSLCLQPSIPRSVAEAALRQRPRSRSPGKKGPKSKAKKDDPTQKPDFQGFSTNKLAKDMASYGFKPIKNREQMITLLEKCWEGKTRMALQSLPSNANLSNLGPTAVAAEDSKAPSPAMKRGRPAIVKAIVAAPKYAGGEAPPSKPRGRPRKTTSTSTTAISPHKVVQQKAPVVAAAAPTRPRTPTKAKSKAPASTIEEIEDSDPPLTPSPPRRSSPTTPRALKLTRPSTEQTPQLTLGAGQLHLFNKITEAITTFPPTHNPKNLTWHEKILMYDPVVLEDLAAWLNTEGLGRVGVDEEVGAAAVRAWCEEKSICCLWTENLRGGARARY